VKPIKPWLVVLAVSFACARSNVAFAQAVEANLSTLTAIQARLRAADTSDAQRTADLNTLRSVASDVEQGELALRAHFILFHALNRPEDEQEAIQLAQRAASFLLVQRDPATHASWLKSLAWANVRALDEEGALPAISASISSPAPLPETHKASYAQLVAATDAYLGLVLPEESSQPLRAGATLDSVIAMSADVVEQSMRFERHEQAISIGERVLPVLARSTEVVSPHIEPRLEGMRFAIGGAHLLDGGVANAMRVHANLPAPERSSGSAALNIVGFALWRTDGAVSRKFLLGVLEAEAALAAGQRVAPTTQWISCVLLIDPGTIDESRVLEVVAHIDGMLAQGDHPGLREWGRGYKNPIMVRDNLVAVQENYATFRLQVAKLHLLKRAGAEHAAAATAQEQAIEARFPGSRALVRSFISGTQAE
jgi:hypothetical protein